MNCKYCQAELEEGTSVCPNCGEVLTEKPKKTSWTAWLAVAVAAVLLVVLVAVVVVGINSVDQGEATEPSASVSVTEPQNATEPAGSAVVLGLPEVGTIASYSSDPDALAGAASAIVATVGDQTLTNEQLQIFYWMQYVDFLNYYGYYAYYLMDDTVPFDQQKVLESEITWEQYFLDSAIRTWHRYTTLCLMADEAGFTLEEELQAELDSLVQTMESDAVEAGYANADEMLVAQMAPGCTVEAYLYYTGLYYKGISYFNEIYNGLNPTEEEIKAYFDEHAAEFEAQGITAQSAPIVDVRHILLMPTGGIADASGNVTYSDAEWETCYNEAQAILDTWKAGEATEASFAELANLHSKDGGSNTTGGLYEYVTDDGTYVEAFTQWAVDASRQTGDTGIVQTEYGYHIMYFVQGEEAWHLYAQESLISELGNQRIAEGEEAHPMTLELSNIRLGVLSQAPAEETTPATEGTTAPTTAE